MLTLRRRELLAGAAAIAALPHAPAWAATAAVRAKPLPLAAVRLKPSDHARAVEANRAYLHRLQPDRLLHNFRKYAGLEPKAPIYGGWESDTIAGHTLGHYLTALVLMHQQTGDAEMRRRADTIVGELAEAQAKRGNGYVGALGRKRKDGSVVDGEEIFPEIMRGDIRSTGFDLNGSWAPLYTMHKLFAGLLDVHGAWGNLQALSVVEGLGAYFEKVFAPLTADQVQQVLACEYGGLAESYAELAARTGNARWLKMAALLYDKKVLDPIFAGEDRLANIHANTQIPKLIAQARIHEVSDAPDRAKAARFFWDRVTGHHSYVIGGNADREYFFEPDQIAKHITEQTCEHCNSYNMMKLTRHLWQWQPHGALFDYYERTHLNHTLAAQDPDTGGFTYMTPLMSGIAREFSSAEDDQFWCCVGSGMEAHSKHGDSIFWEGADGTLFVNLYIPADAQWAARRAQLSLETGYPYAGEATLSFARLKPGRFPVALRVPGWAAGKAEILVNGKPAQAQVSRGYASVTRHWKAGDSIAIRLPMELRLEPTQGDDGTVAVLRGPLVLAADLGPADQPFAGAAPALVGADLLAGFSASDPAGALYAARGVARPGDLAFAPFHRQYQRRSAVYFRRFTDGEWAAEEAAFLAEQARLKDLAARSVDVMHLGEMQPERDHDLTSEISYPVVYRGRQGRDARSGGFIEFTMKVKPGPLLLQSSYWGDERPRSFDILIDGQRIATQKLGHDKPGEFIDIDTPVPEALTRGKTSVRVKFVPHDRNTAGPVFGVRLFTQKQP
ncbi:glycoside hydrolase family 127 protein [Sandaracinobacter neustonicus]|uniref:Glycoside hydrolase family 127 protein n=1 Tax=Sandaracinobacter neustonicus TaxID=1715348 RepID=A0A501XXK1_9SPHN|nr:glycoside hydrolase family 127 protein [Sandaracinobacter neustonicus]TPE64787.1 glycoside hydrolase family 127 protein [Sandaracinobacter neustonicus]